MSKISSNQKRELNKLFRLKQEANLELKRAETYLSHIHYKIIEKKENEQIESLEKTRYFKFTDNWAFYKLKADKAEKKYHHLLDLIVRNIKE